MVFIERERKVYIACSTVHKFITTSISIFKEEEIVYVVTDRMWIYKRKGGFK